jgi:predicted transposase YdaD
VWRCCYKDSDDIASLAFLFEHKSYKPDFPHLQLMDYLTGAWRVQIKAEKTPVLMIPIIIYHGEKEWVKQSFESYFPNVKPEFLRFLPSFDYILVNLQDYTDTKILGFDSIFLQKTVLALKHSNDKKYLDLRLEMLWLSGYQDRKNDATRSYIRVIGLYLNAIIPLPKRVMMDRANVYDNIENEEYEGVDIFEDFINEGIEKGIEIHARETVIRCHKNGINLPLIANIAGLEIGQVEAILAEHLANKAADDNLTQAS